VHTGWATHALRRLFGKEIITSLEILVSNGLQCAAERPLIARKTSLCQGDQEIGSILVLIDLNECPGPSIDILRLTFGLTVAEAKLAARLASGESLHCIATDQNISVATVRAQLKRVLAKTYTHRQAEVVALVNRLVLIPQ
jgi:DNA-binding CsgD family transcriptional regulator